MTTVLIDTNILLDHLLRREPHYHSAAAVWDLVVTKRISGVVSAISFNNAYYVSRKLKGHSKAFAVIEEIRHVFEFVPLDQEVVDRALSRKEDDFEDSVQLISAQIVRADFIVTRNIVDFKNSTIPAITADELLAVVS